MLTLDQLRTEVESGAIDTVVTAFTDMQGRLMGKREQAEYFLDESAKHGIEKMNEPDTGARFPHAARLRAIREDTEDPAA